MKRFCILPIFIFFTLFTAVPHPHLYIDMELALEIDDMGIEGISQRWILLRNFSSDIISEYDTDKNNYLDVEEQNNIYNKAFLGASEYYYFTYIDLDDTSYVSQSIENFSATIQGDRVVYSFFVPMRIYAIEEVKSLDIITYDPTSYVSFGFQGLRDPVNENLDYSITLVRDGNIYSHRNDLGQIHLLIDLKQSSIGASKYYQADKSDILTPIVSQPPIPKETTSNPFLISGVWTKTDREINPFLN